MSNTARIARGRHLCRTGRLHELRVAADVSHSEIAAEVGVTTACVAGWERGRWLPRGENAERLARVLDRLAAELQR